MTPQQFDDEKEKGRVIEAVEPEREPVPCYLNTGCGLYSDDLTCIEIEDDAIPLIKWSNSVHDTAETPLRDPYDERKLSDLMDQIVG